ncbi:MAG: transposase family protein, partial [Bacteroides sp.]|nr:transposase family protein [Bacteroides sp.]
TKKPRGRELTPEQKAENRNISARRIRVEHAIGGAKRLRIVKDECRLRANNYVGRIFHIAAGIHNWRVVSKLA